MTLVCVNGLPLRAGVSRQAGLAWPGVMLPLGQGVCLPGDLSPWGWVGAFPNALCCLWGHACLCACSCEFLVCVCLVKMYDFECGWVISLVLQPLQIARAVLCLAGLRPGPGVLPGAVVCGSLCCMVGPGSGGADGPWVSCYRVCVGVLVVVVGAAAPHYLVLMSFAVWPLLGSPSLFFPAGVIEVSVFLWCVWPVAWFSLLGLRCPGLTQVADTFTHITHTRSIATDLHKHSCRLTLTAVSHVWRVHWGDWR